MSESLAQIKKLLVGLAEVYGEALSAQRLGLYAEILSEFSPGEIEYAIKKILRDPKQTRFPLPAAITEVIEPATNPEIAAIEASNRIVEAISRFGYPNENEARQFIGELGWHVVQREGGWVSLCERALANQLPTLKAQWRELAKAIYVLAKQGRLSDPPALPGSRSEMPERIGNLIGVTVKKL